MKNFLRSAFAAGLLAFIAYATLTAGPAFGVVSAVPPTITYTGNGTTTLFTVPFNFQHASDLVLTKHAPGAGGGTTVTLALGTDYTVQGVGSSYGGAVALAVALPSGNTLTIIRLVGETQPFSFRSQSYYNPALHEQAFDWLEYQVQQVTAAQADGGSFGGTATSLAPGALIANEPILGDGSSANHLGFDFTTSNVWYGNQTWEAQVVVGTQIYAQSTASFDFSQAGGSFYTAQGPFVSVASSNEFDNQVQVDRLLAADGGEYVNGTLYVDGGVNVAGALTVGYLAVDGGVNINGSEYINGTLTVDGGVVVNASESIDGGLTINGVESLDGGLIITGYMRIDGGVTIQSAILDTTAATVSQGATTQFGALTIDNTVQSQAGLIAAFDLSANGGTFKTTTGASTFGGSSNTFSHSALLNGFTATGNTASYDLSAGSGVFNTTTGAVTIGGAGSTMSFNGNTSRWAASTQFNGFTSQATSLNYDLSAGSGVFSGPTGGSTLNGSTLLNAGLTVGPNSSSYDFSNSSGAFKTSTGASTFGGSSNVFSASGWTSNFPNFITLTSTSPGVTATNSGTGYALSGSNASTGAGVNATNTGSGLALNVDSSFGTGLGASLKGNATNSPVFISPQAAPSTSTHKGDVYFDAIKNRPGYSNGAAFQMIPRGAQTTCAATNCTALSVEVGSVGCIAQPTTSGLATVSACSVNSATGQVTLTMSATTSTALNVIYW